MFLAINDCSASRPWLRQAEEVILYLYWEGLEIENDLLFQGIVNTCHGKVPKLVKGMLDFMEDLSKVVDSH